MAIGSNFKKGSVELLVLMLLTIEDMYGYQLTQLIAEHSNQVFLLKEGSLYPTLYRLVEQKYITSRRVNMKKRLVRTYYHIEPEGREHLNLIFSEYTRVHDGIRGVIDFANYQRDRNEP